MNSSVVLFSQKKKKEETMEPKKTGAGSTFSFPVDTLCNTKVQPKNFTFSLIQQFVQFKGSFNPGRSDVRLCI